MEEKTYRVKANAENLRSLTANLGQGRVLNIEEFPYATEDPGEQTYLDSRDDLTDRPLPKAQKNDSQSGNAKLTKEA